MLRGARCSRAGAFCEGRKVVNLRQWVRWGNLGTYDSELAELACGLEEHGNLAASEVEGARVVGDNGKVTVNWGGGSDELEVLAGAAVDFGAVVGHVRRDDDLHGRCGEGRGGRWH